MGSDGAAAELTRDNVARSMEVPLVRVRVRIRARARVRARVRIGVRLEITLYLIESGCPIAR